jgi:hypothetical protein
VTHIYSPSYSRDRDQEDHGSKSAQANSSARIALKKRPSQKRAGGVAQSVGPKLKPQCHKERKKERNMSK